MLQLTVNFIAIPAPARHLWSIQWKLAGCCCWWWWWMAVQEDSKPEASRLHLSHHSVGFSVRRCAVHVHCELWKRLVDYWPVCCQDIIIPHWTSFLTGRERLDHKNDDDKPEPQPTTSNSGLAADPPPQLIFGNSHTGQLWKRHKNR